MPKAGEKSKLKRFLFQNQNLSQTIAKNTFWLSFGEVVGRVLRFTIIFYAARVLGAAGWGTFSYMVSLAAILTVTSDIGLSGVLVREVSREAGNKKAYFSTTFALKSILVVLSFVFLIFGAKAITGIPISQSLVYSTAALFIFDSLRRFGSSIFRAEEKMELEGIINIFTQLMIVIAGFIALIHTPAPESLAMSYAFGAGLGLLATLYFLKPYIKNLFSSFDKELLKPIVKAAWPWTLASIFGVLLVNIDTVMVGWVYDAQEVGLYAAAQKPVAVLYLLPAFVVGGLFPALARLAKDNADKFRSVMERGISMVLLIAYPIVAGILLTSEKIVRLFYGPGFDLAAGPLRILSLTLLITFPITIVIHAMFAYNKQKQMVPLWAAGSVLNVALNWYLIPTLGIVGAAWASLLTQILINSILWRQMKRVNYFSATKNLGSILKSTAVMMVFILGVGFIGIPFSLTMLLSIFVYFGALYMFKDATLLEMKRMFKA